MISYQNFFHKSSIFAPDCQSNTQFCGGSHKIIDKFNKKALLCVCYGVIAQLQATFVRALQKATLCGLSAKLQSPWRSSYDKAQCHSYCDLQSKMKYKKNGVIAQLVARLNGIQKVRGSTPLSSTKKNLNRTTFGLGSSLFLPFKVSNNGFFMPQKPLYTR